MTTSIGLKWKHREKCNSDPWYRPSNASRPRLRGCSDVMYVLDQMPESSPTMSPLGTVENGRRIDFRTTLRTSNRLERNNRCVWFTILDDLWYNLNIWTMGIISLTVRMSRLCSFLNTYLRIFYSIFPLKRVINRNKNYNNNWIPLGLKT
jgi:hypothetical protein